MLKISPQYLTLSKLLEGRLFRIPDYQRAYSWTGRQRRDLFNDILNLHAKGPDAGHFMAAVVCLRRKTLALGTDEFHQVEVVDGQQRLTTLIILLNAVKIALKGENKGEQKAAVELGELLVKTEGDELLLLRTNHDTSHYFSSFLREGTAGPRDKARTLADREILAAIEECCEFVAEWMRTDELLLSLVALLKNRLFFLLHEIEDEKAVYTVFEVLNSRGLEVSWLDRMKSILMGLAFELPNINNEGLISDLHKVWRDVYATIGLRQGLSTEALRFAATLCAVSAPSKPLGEKDAVEELRCSATNAKQIRKIADWIRRVTNACNVVVANSRLNAVTRISQARMLAVAIHLRDDIEERERDELLAVWEKVTFRIYGMLAKDARTKVGDYVRLAWRIINDEISAGEIKSEISEIGRDYPIEVAIEGLKNTDCYTDWEVELRYLMFRYEEYLAKKRKPKFSNEQWEKIWMVSPSKSIEHIWAQSNAPKNAKHRLGNLVLLPPGLNSQLQDIAPKAKIGAYRDTGLLIAQEVAGAIHDNGNKWTSKTIDARERTLLDWAKLEWAD